MKRRFVESAGFSEDRKQLERARELSHDDLAERRAVAALVKQLKEETS